MADRCQGINLTEERVQFNVVRQAPSSYRVENGQILKHMTVILDICDIDGSDTPKVQALLNDVTHVVSPPGTTSGDIEVTEGTPTEEDQVREMKFEIEEEVINIYETKDHLILVASPVQKIFLTNKVDGENNPMLRCLARVALNTIPKPTRVQ